MKKITFTFEERNLAFQAVNSAPATARPGMPFDEEAELKGLWSKLLGGLQRQPDGTYLFRNLGMTSTADLEDKEVELLVKYIGKCSWATLEMKYMMQDFAKRIKSPAA